MGDFDRWFPGGLLAIGDEQPGVDEGGGDGSSVRRQLAEPGPAAGIGSAVAGDDQPCEQLPCGRLRSRVQGLVDGFGAAADRARHPSERGEHVGADAGVDPAGRTARSA